MCFGFYITKRRPELPVQAPNPPINPPNNAVMLTTAGTDRPPSITPIFSVKIPSPDWCSQYAMPAHNKNAAKKPMKKLRPGRNPTTAESNSATPYTAHQGMKLCAA